MRNLIAIAVLTLAACAPEEHVLAGEPTTQLAAPTAGAPSAAAVDVGVQSEELLANTLCDGLKSYAQSWFRSRSTPTSTCSQPGTSTRWDCQTSSPPRTWVVNRTAESYGGYCLETRHSVVPSQSSNWKFKCTQTVSGNKSCATY